MRQVTVSKLQIAQAEQCVERLDKYTRLLDMSIEMLMFAKAESQYNQLPEEFKMVCRRDLEIVMADLKSLKNDAQDMALLKAEKASDLRITRNKQLKEVKMETEEGYRERINEAILRFKKRQKQRRKWKRRKNDRKDR